MGRTAVLFDMMDTLVEYRDQGYDRHAMWLHAFLLEQGWISSPPGDFLAAWNETRARLGSERYPDLREIGLWERVEGTVRALGGSCSRGEAQDGVRAFIDSYIRVTAPMPGALDTLEALGSRHLIGVVTNFQDAEGARRILEANGILPFLDGLVISIEEGRIKPHELLFRRAMERLGVGPAETTFVGDDHDADVQGAARCGMRTIWFARDGNPDQGARSPGLTARTMDDVRALLTG